jgi:hypothetical protein
MGVRRAVDKEVPSRLEKYLPYQAGVRDWLALEATHGW